MNGIMIVAAVLIRRRFGDDYRYLLAKRKKGRFKGCYDTPGGKVEYGECTYKAALRETEEETGLILTDIDLLEVKEIILKKPSRLHYIIHLYEAELPNGEAVNCEPDKKEDWEWLSITEDMQLMPSLVALEKNGYFKES